MSELEAVQRENAFLRNKIKAMESADEGPISRAIGALSEAANARGTTPNQPNFVDKTGLLDSIDLALQLLNPLVRRG